MQQLQELSDEDFRQLCVAVGMAGKPLHVMRFRRALQRHYHTSGPQSHHNDHITSSPALLHPIQKSTDIPLLGAPSSQKAYETTQNTAELPRQQSIPHLHVCKREPQEDAEPMPPWAQQGPGDQRENFSPPTTRQVQFGHSREPETPPTSSYCYSNEVNKWAWHESASTTPPSPGTDWIPLEELVDELTPLQCQLGPAPFSPHVWDRKRAELIRKSSTIYGSHMAKRKHLPLTAHEEQVNEAAFQLCLRDPTLLVRRDELFLLARRAVKKRLGCANGHGDSMRGQQQQHSSGLSHRTCPRGQKRACPNGDCSSNDVDRSLTACVKEAKAEMPQNATCMALVTPRREVVPRPSDYTTLYTLPVWTGAVAAALRGDAPTADPRDPSVTGTRRLQSQNDESAHTWRSALRLVSQKEGGSPSSLEECSGAYFTSQVPVLQNLSPPLHNSTHLSSSSSSLSSSSLYNTSDANQLVEHVNKSANEAVQLLSSFTRVDHHRVHTRGYNT